MTFNTYHWWGCPLEDPELESERIALESGEPDVSAFLKLLRSGRVVAVGISLDYYAHADTTMRFTGSNPYSECAEEVLGRAREILSGPPLPRSTTGAQREGADHASALLVMLNLAQPEDAELIAAALRQSTDVNVEVAATMAASTVLNRSTVASQDLVGALSDLIFDETRSTNERLDALRAFNDSESPQAAEVAVRALTAGNADLQVHAALILATHHLAAHREAVEEVVASWSDDVSLQAEFVLDALRADDDRNAE